jgi:hypothetical protein
VVGGGEGWDKASGGGPEGNPPRVSGGLRQNAQPGFGSARANRCQDPRGSVSMGKYRNSFGTVKAECINNVPGVIFIQEEWRLAG